MAKSKKIGNVYAELSVRDKMSMGLKKARQSLVRFGAQSLKAGAVMGGAVATGLAIGSKRIITMGADLDHLSTQSGVSVASLMKLQQAYKDNGKDAKSAGKDIGKMQRAIWEATQDPGGSMDFFKDIGLSAKELIALTPEQQFFAIGDALNKVQNQTKRAAIAMDIFGRSGGQLLTVFAGSNLDDVNESLGKMPEVMDKFSAAFERVDTLMGRLPNKSDQFFTGFSAGIVGQLLPGLEKANGFDFTELGENLGKKIAFGMEGLTSGKLIEVFSLKATAAFVEMGEELANALAAGARAGWKAASSIIKNEGAGHGTITTWIGDMVTKAGTKDVQDRWESIKKREAENRPDAMKVFMDEIGKNTFKGSGIPEQMRAEADRLWNSIGKTVEEKTQKAVELGWGDAQIPFLSDIEGVLGMIPQLQTSQPTAAIAEASFDGMESAVNSMQARGLGQGAMYVSKEVKDQVSYLKMIYEQLKKESKKEEPLAVF